MTYIGIDLHTDRFNCNFISARNEISRETFMLDSSAIKRFYSYLSIDDYVSIEASTNTFAFYDLLKDRVKDVLVINPYKFKIIGESGMKSDKIDAEKSARMLKYHIEADNKFLPLVYVPNETIRKLRSLFTTYQQYQRMIVGEKNRIHSILKQNLKPYNQKDIFGDKKRNEILNLELSEEYKIQIKLLYETIDLLEEKALKIKEQILYTGRSYIKEIDILTSISGISPFIALALIADYADITRFKNAKRFCSYLRSAQKLDQSNQQVKVGHTNKAGRKLALSLLLQSIHHIVRINPVLKEFRLRHEKGGKKVNIIRMAAARKTLASIYFMLKKNEYYRYRNAEYHKKKMEEYNRFISKYQPKN
jgi:transposase